MLVSPVHPPNALPPISVTLLGIFVFLHPAIKVLLDFSIIALQLLRLSYLGLPFSTTMLSSPSQPSNALNSMHVGPRRITRPMYVTLFGIVILLRLEQSLNASSPMLVTLLGIVMLLSPSQPSNALYPILFTLFGIVMLVSPVHPLNALLPMLVTLLGIFVFLHPAIKVLLDFSIIALQLLRLSYLGLQSSTTIRSRPVQPLNATELIYVTPLGIVMLVRPVQP